MFKNAMTFSPTDIDDFDDELDNFPVDSLFGRNKQKKAERKVKKAQKQLAKGHIKKAEKKLSKAGKLQGQISSAQSGLQQAIDQQKQINAAQQNLNTMSTASNESMQTEAGQIGLAAMPTQQTQTQAQGSTVGGGGGNGGGGGDMDSGITGMDADTQTLDESLTGSDEPTGKLAETKTLAGVTVKSNKWKGLLIAAGIVLVVIAILYFTKSKAPKV